MKDKKPIEECTLSNEDLRSNVTDWVDKLCKSGGKSWSLRVPVDFNHDPDMTILALVDRFAELEKKLEIAVELLESSINVIFSNQTTDKAIVQTKIVNFLRSIEKENQNEM